MNQKKIILILLGIVFSSCTDNQKIIYYPNGKIKKEVSLQNNQLEGVSKFYYESGKLRGESTYNKGILNGKKILYFENGNVKWQGIYRQGKLIEVAKEYYENGNIKVFAPMKDGEQNGTVIDYYENGIIKSKVNFSSGIKNGDVVFYYPNSKIKLKGLVFNGYTVFYSEYDINGRPIKDVRSVDYIIKFDSIKLGETYTAQIKLLGSIDDVKVKAYLEGSIKSQNNAVLKMIGDGIAEYKMTPKTTGVYGWSMYFEVIPNNDTTHFYYKAENAFVVIK